MAQASHPELISRRSYHRAHRCRGLDPQPTGLSTTRDDKDQQHDKASHVVFPLSLAGTLRLTSNHLAELPFRPRARIIVVVLATFVGHTAAVWTYAFAYWMLR